MKSFTYSGRDANGKSVKGVIHAENEAEFKEKVKERGLYVENVQEEDSDNSRSMYKFNTKELNFCCRQLSAMLTSGLTLVKAIDILTKEQENEKARAIWQDIYENVQKGESFSSTLEMHAGSFPEFLISMVGAGESSGSLDVIMTRMADHYAKENKLKNTVRSAMTYPIILAIICIVVVIFLVLIRKPRVHCVDPIVTLCRHLVQNLHNRRNIHQSIQEIRIVFADGFNMDIFIKFHYIIMREGRPLPYDPYFNDGTVSFP